MLKRFGTSENHKTFHPSHQANPQRNYTYPEKKAWNLPKPPFCVLGKLSEHRPCTALRRPPEGGRRPSACSCFQPEGAAKGKKLGCKRDQNHFSHPSYRVQLFLKHDAHLSLNSCALLPEKSVIILKVAAAKLCPVLGFCHVFWFRFLNTISLWNVKGTVTDFTTLSCNYVDNYVVALAKRSHESSGERTKN